MRGLVLILVCGLSVTASASLRDVVSLGAQSATKTFTGFCQKHLMAPPEAEIVYLEPAESRELTYFESQYYNWAVQVQSVAAPDWVRTGWQQQLAFYGSMLRARAHAYGHDVFELLNKFGALESGRLPEVQPENPDPFLETKYGLH